MLQKKRIKYVKFTALRCQMSELVIKMKVLKRIKNEKI